MKKKNGILADEAGKRLPRKLDTHPEPELSGISVMRDFNVSMRPTRTRFLDTQKDVGL